MQSQAQTVDAYLAELPQDRRLAISAVRQVILQNLDPDYEEGMQYGMIGYYVPLRVYPAGYHCDPTQPLCFAGLASQKNHMSLYLMSVYGDDNPYKTWFLKAWKKSGKKLDMGKACIRFRKVEDLPLDVIGEAIRRMPTKKYLAIYEAIKDTIHKRPGKKIARAAKTKRPQRGAAKLKSMGKARARNRG